MCFAPQRRALFRDLNFQKWSEPLVFLTVWLPNVLRATTACTFSRSELPKVVRTPGVFNILTWKCASCHNGVHFFDISTSKSGPRPPVFNTFDFKIYFAPQRRALFRHRNFQKWSEPLVFCTFWLQNILRATTACTFSTSQLPKVVRTPGVLYILTWKCASRHNGVHFFDIGNFQKWSDNGVFCTFWLRNVLRATTACNFSSLIWPAGSAPAALASLLFEPSEPQIIGKTQCFATSLPFRASASSFFWLFLFSDLLSSNLSLLSASALLCFSSVHIVESLASKLPSTSASVKSYQLVKVVSGGWKKFNLCIELNFKAYIWSFFQGGKRWLLLVCCLPAACCSLLLLAAAYLLLTWCDFAISPPCHDVT